MFDWCENLAIFGAKEKEKSDCKMLKNRLFINNTLTKYVSRFAYVLSMLLFFCLSNVHAQDHVSMDYYLVESLNLHDMSTEDKELLESTLKKFHQSKSTFQKIKILSDVCENMVHDDWIKYQIIQKDLIEQELKKEISDT